MCKFNDPFIVNAAKTYRTLSEPSGEGNKQKLEFALRILPMLASPAVIESADQYETAETLRNLCGDIWWAGDCLNETPDMKQASATSSAIFKRMKAYNNKFLLKDPKKLLVARYLLWAYIFPDLPARTAFLAAREYGFLRRSAHPGSDAVYVVGLSRKVGDNMFTVDSRGRQHRQYNETLGRMAFYVTKDMGMSEGERRAFIASLPVLDEGYHDTSIGDRKYGSRGSAFSRVARTECFKLLNSDWARSLNLSVHAPPAALPAPPPRDMAVTVGAQLELLAA